MRVFICHSSMDKPAVESLAIALRAAGIDAWLDTWEIASGDSIVASINDGLQNADAGIIVFSQHTRDNRWVSAEVDYLTYAHIYEGKLLIPVVVGEGYEIPPLLRPKARRAIDEVEAITNALFNRRPVAPNVQRSERGRVERVLISLHRDQVGGIRTEVRIGGELYGSETFAGIPHRLLRARDSFLQGFRSGYGPGAVAERTVADEVLLKLGRELRELCLPGDTGQALAHLVDGRVGTIVEVCFEAADSELLGLPFEALRLPDDRVLATQAPVVVLRRPTGLSAPTWTPLAGPIKILVAVGAPDEGQTTSAVLDLERELQSILDAVEPAQRLENVEVRILEVGNAEVIGEAIERDAYHVLHISAHGTPGSIELEDEEGHSVSTTAAELLDPIRRTGRPLPLVFLNTCHGGVLARQAASFAEDLLRAGVPCVLAMQASVTDRYATDLAKAFYEHLARHEPPMAGRALAAARKEIERARQTAISQGSAPTETQPEYAAASLFVADKELALADLSLDREPLRARSVHDLGGPVPQLQIGDLIGRRKELRDTLRTLRDQGREYVGVVLTGIGGVGKSAVAGRAMRRCVESGLMVAAHKGRFDLRQIALGLGEALLESDKESSRKRANRLTDPNLEDELRLRLVSSALAEEPIVLVLDDFEQNLAEGGGAFLDPSVADWLDSIAATSPRGKLLITCRYPVPGTEGYLRRVPIGPLSHAEVRKLILRLPALKVSNPADLTLIVRTIGGHPRMLELIDALLRGGKGRLPHITIKLKALMKESGIDAAGPRPSLEGAIETALLVGARDIFLKELLDIARSEGIDGILLQAATSNLPVSPEGLARMLADGAEELPNVAIGIDRLDELSLLHRFPDGSVWVHRWTAVGLAGLVDRDGHLERFNRAGRHRCWRIKNEGHNFYDLVEAVRNFLVGQEFDNAAAVGSACLDLLHKGGQTSGIATLASEILEILPESNLIFGDIADKEATALLALGSTERAADRYHQLRDIAERKVKAEPTRAEFQRDLSAWYERLGDVYDALDQGELSREYYMKSYRIIEMLAAAVPDRVDYQIQLSVSYERLGKVYRTLDQNERSRDYFLKSLTIAERLAEAEPGRADYQRGLSITYNKLGNLYRTIGQGEQARDYLVKSLNIAETLATADPERIDYQHILSYSYVELGDVYSLLEQTELSRDYFLKSLTIFERLAKVAPDRADYQHDLLVSYERLGNVYRALDQGELSRDYFLRSHGIREALAIAHPDRTAYQHELSVSFGMLSDVYRALGQGERADECVDKSLAIAERIAHLEPSRADYQRNLVVSLVRAKSTDDSDDSSYTIRLTRALAVLEILKRICALSNSDEELLATLREYLHGTT